MLQLKQSLVSLHDIHSPQQGPMGGAATDNPLEAVMSTSAASQTEELVEQLKREEAQLQQRMVEIDAQLQYAEQVRHRAWWGSVTEIINNIDSNNNDNNNIDNNNNE